MIKNNLLLTAFVLLGYFVPLSDANFVCQNETHHLTSNWTGPDDYLATYQNCFYKFTWDQDHYVTVLAIVRGSNLPGDRVDITDSKGNTVEVTEGPSRSYSRVYLLSGLTIHVQTEINDRLEVTLRLYLRSKKLGPPSGISKSIKVQPNALTQVSICYYCVVTAKTKVFMTIFPQDDNSTLHNALLYDGSGPSAKFIGSAYNYRQYISTGNTLTLYPDPIAPFGTYVLFDDYENIKQFSNIETSWTWDKSDFPKSIEMNATNGPAVLIVARNYGDYPTYLRKMGLSDPTATISVHPGANFINNMLFQYSGNVDNKMPQQFPVSLFTTFVLNKGKADLILTSSTTSQQWQGLADWTDAYVGREGYLISWYYGSLVTNQSVDMFEGYFDAQRLVTFELSFVKGNVADPNAYLNASLYDGSKSNYTMIKMSDLQKNAVSFVSAFMQPNYVSSGLSTGIILKFKVQDYNGCPTQFGFISVLLILYYMLA